MARWTLTVAPFTSLGKEKRATEAAAPQLRSGTLRRLLHPQFRPSRSLRRRDLAPG